MLPNLRSLLEITMQAKWVKMNVAINSFEANLNVYCKLNKIGKEITVGFLATAEQTEKEPFLEDCTDQDLVIMDAYYRAYNIRPFPLQTEEEKEFALNYKLKYGKWKKELPSLERELPKSMEEVMKNLGINHFSMSKAIKS